MNPVKNDQETLAQNSFNYGKGFFEKVKSLKASGKITSMEAIQMLDDERDNFGDFRSFYDENRIRIINSLF